MVLQLQLAYFVLVAALVVLCVIVSKLRELAEKGRSVDQVLILMRRLEDEAEVVAPCSPDHSMCTRRVGFGAGSGLSGECARESAGSRKEGREIETEMQRKETQPSSRTEESRRSSGPIDEKEEHDNDDDWEGIEKTELQRTFDRAVRFVGSLKSSGLVGSRIGRDEKMKLYGLHKIATEGPCLQSLLLPFKVSFRWFFMNPKAFQQLGNMSPEDAMEQYIDFVSIICPDWMQNDLDCKHPTLKLPDQ
ncbi:acyl-CoA-binding domain-containing protein 1-like [Punica granatum]|uniref:ACB domain-containing protein n=2 Tax=Punica granatum TaxID=22663 RepID=A0A218XA53_PUNGR|nr:acyl-CoA-binding domain-containing protein 1-like [Punica granatum]OWM82115.1 hypothetical protein CDL15_Pgr001689 [Punica granatum]PKI41230.1 hypothetical protein CRG98_038342 [Punica granatum]